MWGWCPAAVVVPDGTTGFLPTGPDGADGAPAATFREDRRSPASRRPGHHTRPLPPTRRMLPRNEDDPAVSGEAVNGYVVRRLTATSASIMPTATAATRKVGATKRQPTADA